MPVLDFQSPAEHPPERLLPEVAEAISTILQLPDDRVWVFWYRIHDRNYFRRQWTKDLHCPAPVVRIRCKEDYSPSQVAAVLSTVAGLVSRHCGVDKGDVYIVVDRVLKGQLFVRGEIWE